MNVHSHQTPQWKMVLWLLWKYLKWIIVHTHLYIIIEIKTREPNCLTKKTSSTTILLVTQRIASAFIFQDGGTFHQNIKTGIRWFENGPQYRYVFTPRGSKECEEFFKTSSTKDENKNGNFGRRTMPVTTIGVGEDRTRFLVFCTLSWYCIFYTASENLLSFG